MPKYLTGPVVKLNRKIFYIDFQKLLLSYHYWKILSFWLRTYVFKKIDFLVTTSFHFSGWTKTSLDFKIQLDFRKLGSGTVPIPSSVNLRPTKLIKVMTMLRIGLVTSTLLLIVSANHVSMAFLQPSRRHKTTPSCVCSNYKFGIHTNQVSVLKTQFHKKTLVSFSILVVDGDKKNRLRRMNELLNRLQAWILMLVR